MFRLSVCAETVFGSLPFLERVRRISQAGFLVEFWRREQDDINAVANLGVEVGTFSGSDDGSMVHPDGTEKFLDDVRLRVAFAKRLQCQQINLLTGSVGANGHGNHKIAENPITRWITAYKTLLQIADLAEKHDLFYNLEVLNTKTDHPGYSLFRVEDGVRLVREVGSPRVRLLFDIYHVQIEEGNVISLLREYAKEIGYVHVADVPGRHEPGTGEINYPQIVKTLHEIGYTGVVGLEAFPLNGDEQAMERFREVFYE